MNHAEDAKKRNNDLINEMIFTNKELKTLKQHLINKKKAMKKSKTQTFNAISIQDDVLFWKKKFNKIKDQNNKKRKYLISL